MKNRKFLSEFSINFQDAEVNREAPKIIPVVFHIIHNYGPENISDNQVFDVMRIINEDFRKLNKDISSVIPAFSAIASDCGVEFRLARKDPNGKCTNGITRVVSPLTFSAGENVKSLISWPTNKYLNVWVVAKLSSGFGGYATFPGNPEGTPTDGIVVSNRQLGSIGESSQTNFAARTLTHEIGHFFNLSHVWGNGELNSNDNCFLEGDYVDDTPVCRGTTSTSSTCNLNQNTCITNPNDKVDNVQNYMDYSGCSCMFTIGQRNRMTATLNSSVSGRNKLWSGVNLIATGVDSPLPPCIPIPDFTINFNQVCTNNNLILKDCSYNAALDASWRWEWNIPGATPQISYVQNPTISFSNPGSYSVTLKVTNSSGSASLTKQQFIYINSDSPTLTIPLTEGFESSLFPNSVAFDNRWKYEGPSGAFIRSTASKASGIASLKYQNTKQPEQGIVSLISPALDFSKTTTSSYVVFKIAYARLNALSSDRLEVSASRDCGKTWLKSYSKSGSDLATVGTNILGLFTPSPSQWRTDTVKLSALLAGRKSIIIKFTITDGNGNDIYLDDINIVSNLSVGISDSPEIVNILSLYPNPGKQNAEMMYTLSRPCGVRLLVYDAAGRICHVKNLGLMPAGTHHSLINDNIGNAFSPGFYFVRLEAGNSRITQKWICQ